MWKIQGSNRIAWAFLWNSHPHDDMPTETEKYKLIRVFSFLCWREGLKSRCKMSGTTIGKKA